MRYGSGVYCQVEGLGSTLVGLKTNDSTIVNIGTYVQRLEKIARKKALKPQELSFPSANLSDV